MGYPPYPDDPALRRLQRRMLAAGVTIAAGLIVLLVLTLPVPRDSGRAGVYSAQPGDMFLVGPDAALIVRMPAADRGTSVVTRRQVRDYRARLAALSARCGGLDEGRTAGLVDDYRAGVRRAGRPVTYARAMAELSFAVEMAGDRDCAAAVRGVTEPH